MIRAFSLLSLGMALSLIAFADAGAQTPAQAKTKNNQMVKGTIKTVDASKDVLIVNQKVKNETVDRELSILDTTEFILTTAAGTKSANGNAGLRLLEGQEGATVQVKCDKDVNVLKVTVKSKK